MLTEADSLTPFSQKSNANEKAHAPPIMIVAVDMQYFFALHAHDSKPALAIDLSKGNLRTYPDRTHSVNPKLRFVSIDHLVVRQWGLSTCAQHYQVVFRRDLLHAQRCYSKRLEEMYRRITIAGEELRP